MQCLMIMNTMFTLALAFICLLILNSSKLNMTVKVVLTIITILYIDLKTVQMYWLFL